MTTLIEAAKQALEALEFDGFTPEDLTHRSLHAKAITALHTAIKAAEKQEPVHQWRKKHSAYWYDGYPDNDDGGGPYETRTLYTTPPPCLTCEALARSVMMDQTGRDA